MSKLGKKKIQIQFKRPREFAKDSSSTYDAVKHAVNWLKNNENWKTDIVVILPPTSPFRRASHIDKVVNLLIRSKSDAAMTITDPSYPPHWMFKKIGKNYKFVLPEGKKIQRRQDAPKVYQPAGMVYAIKSEFLFKMKGILPQGKTVGLFIEKDVAINIDKPLDYTLAKILLEKKL